MSVHCIWTQTCRFDFYIRLSDSHFYGCFTGKKPANKQKGEKICNFCREKKKLTSFYISKSPLYSVDERVPVCKECVINASLNENGTINEPELNKILKKLINHTTKI